LFDFIVSNENVGTNGIDLHENKSPEEFKGKFNQYDFESKNKRNIFLKLLMQCNGKVP
jgi:hypothetical protein